VILVDENFTAAQCRELVAKSLRITQIGHGVASKGIIDEHIVPLLLTLRRPTFFTQDKGFFDYRLCHSSYCIVVVDAEARRVPDFVIRALRHLRLRSFRQRTGLVVKVGPSGITLLNAGSPKPILVPW
jgi:hypothetical protein